jgi:hypothetical protein
VSAPVGSQRRQTGAGLSNLGSRPDCDRLEQSPLIMNVEAQERRWAAPLESKPVEDGDDLVGVDGPVGLDRERFAGELIDDVEQLQGAALGGDVELEVARPQRVRTDRAHRPDVGPDPGQPLLLHAPEGPSGPLHATDDGSACR